MTADAAAIPDAETIVADVTVDVTMDADVTMDVATSTAAGSSLYCVCSAAMAADVDADNHFIQAEGRSLCLFSGCRPLRTN